MPNDLSAFNAQAWSKSLVANINQINVMLGLVNRDYEGELQNVGDTVWVRTLGSVTLGSYARGDVISYQNLVPVKEALVVADAEYFAFNVDDLDKAQNDIAALEAYTKRAAVGVSNTIEAKLQSYYASAHSANQISSSGSNITLSASNIYGYLVAARAALSKFNVPTAGRWLIVDPDTTSFLLQSTQFIRATDLGDLVVKEGNLNGLVNRPGFIGRCAGFDIYESTAVPIVSSSKYLQFGDNAAISYAAQINQMEALRLQTTFATAVRGLLLHDGKVFAENAKRLGYIKAAP